MIKDLIREFEISIDKFQKEDAEMRFEIKKEDEVKTNVSDEAKIIEFKKRQVESKTTDKSGEMERINQQIEEMER